MNAQAMHAGHQPIREPVSPATDKGGLSDILFMQDVPVELAIPSSKL